MNRKNIFILATFVIIVIIGFLMFKAFGKNNNPIASDKALIVSPTPTAAPQITMIPADKIEIVHFHATQQCWSCITVGEYALKTIKEKFPQEYASGKIIFKDINGELKENQEIVVKYQAGGSSLFTNAIRGKRDDIVEDVTVWRLVNNESQFITYFENKLKTLLGDQ